MASKENRYEELANNVVSLIGGKENVAFFTHCATRLRFSVKEKGTVDLDAIKKLPGVLGAQISGDQLHIIIGPSVGDAYALICKKHGFASKKAVEENLDTPKKKKLSIAAILDFITGCVTPIIPVLMAGGFIKMVAILGEQFGFLAAGTPTHTVLTFAGDAAFYFLPVFVGATTAKKAGGNQLLGMMLGAMFIHPDFIAALAAGPLSVFSIPIYNTGYASSLMPAMLSAAVMSQLQKRIAKHSPDALRSITEPFLTMLIMIPVSLCVLGPIGAFLGTYLANGIIWLYETTGFLGVAIFAAISPLLIMTGMHTALATYLMASFASVGWEGIVLTGMIVSNIDLGVSCLVAALKSKNKDRRATALGCGITATLSGIVEPGIFGVSIPLRTPLYGGMIGTLFGGAIAGFLKAHAYVMTGAPGLLGGLPIYLGGGMGNFINMCIAVGVGMVITFIATMLLYKEPADTQV